MTDANKIPHRVDLDGNKVPRIAIMGEFSAGKSTLCNMLMSGDTLPRKVTATQLAPVWMTKGDGDHVRVQTDGTQTPIEIDQLSSVPIEGTHYIRLGLPQDVFDFCDLIDFPGISDPNMDPDVWARLLVEADAVIWLTHATQAWRQTEAAVWDMVSEDVQQKSLLLLTRWDKVTSEQDRTRILRRLERETQGLFKAMLPISLLDATNAGEDQAAWSASGASAFMSHLTDIVTEFKTNVTANPHPSGAIQKSAQTSDAIEDPAHLSGADQDYAQPPVQDAPIAKPTVRISDVGPAQATGADSMAASSKIIPRRVVASSTRTRERPRIEATARN